MMFFDLRRGLHGLGREFYIRTWLHNKGFMHLKKCSRHLHLILENLFLPALAGLIAANRPFEIAISEAAIM